jgi:hypothetical protein
MNREFLQNALDALTASQEQEPDKGHAVEFSIDLFPDGIGYVCSSPKLSIIVSEETAKSETEDLHDKARLLRGAARNDE